MNGLGMGEGLAQSAVKQTNPMRDLHQIVAMLMQGVNPEELIAQGLPPELVQAAMEMVSKQTTQVPEEQLGLAASQVKAMPR